jgi:hypothetical protein
MRSTKNTPTLALMLLASGALCAQEYSLRSFGVTEGLNNLGVPVSGAVRKAVAGVWEPRGCRVNRLRIALGAHHGYTVRRIARSRSGH